jgi:hypothetical protein
VFAKPASLGHIGAEQSSKYLQSIDLPFTSHRQGNTPAE